MDFEGIWEDQKGFNSKLFDIRALASNPEEFQRWNNFLCLALHREVGEVLETVDWKIHRNHYKAAIRSNTLEELIDILKYWMSLAQLYGFTPEDVERGYWRKSGVVEQRHRQEIANNISEEGKKIVGIDIDGVLADYPRSFLDFINAELGTAFSPEDITEYSGIYDLCGIPTDLGIQLKNKYRETGQKRFIPVCKGVQEFIAFLREEGYAIVLLTARPYQTYKRIFAGTIEWLKKNGIHYDMVIFDENKEEALINEFGSKVEFFVEDNPSNAKKISRLGIKCYLVEHPYNRTFSQEGVAKVKDLEELRCQLAQQLTR